jgi:hypothetical protein
VSRHPTSLSALAAVLTSSGRSLRVEQKRLARVATGLRNAARVPLTGDTADRHPGGLVKREDDGRLSFTTTEREYIKALYESYRLKRGKCVPCQQKAMGRLLAFVSAHCIRCNSRSIRQVSRRPKGRFGLYRCKHPECGLRFSYHTLWRICTSPASATSRARRPSTEAIPNLCP